MVREREMIRRREFRIRLVRFRGVYWIVEHCLPGRRGRIAGCWALQVAVRIENALNRVRFIVI
jgi:hypothetical protein